jgi:hypothetical protein
VPGRTALPMIASGAMREPTVRRQITSAADSGWPAVGLSGTSTGCRSLMARSAVFDSAPCWHVRAKPTGNGADEPLGEEPEVARSPVLRWRRAFGPWRGPS